ncbi:hypothetical protein FI667_g6002, partial [Globisporangium splendens]
MSEPAPANPTSHDNNDVTPSVSSGEEQRRRREHEEELERLARAAEISRHEVKSVMGSHGSKHQEQPQQPEVLFGRAAKYYNRSGHGHLFQPDNAPKSPAKQLDHP